MWHPLKSFPHDCTAAEATLDLNTKLPTSVPVNGSVYFVIRNRGVASAFLNRSDDTIDSALEIEGQSREEAGPYAWPGDIPVLHGLVGSDCVVTLFVKGTP